PPPVPQSNMGACDFDDPTPTLREVLERTERQYLQDIIFSTQGGVKELCRKSGLSRTRLYERLKKYNLSLSNDHK
ncbi:MAG: helix-turn-helix domain-containing protein, partial [Syntrophobacteraceae bacterium]